MVFFSFFFFFGGSLAGATTFFAGGRFCFFAGGGGVTMEATLTLECSSAHEMMVMENVPVILAETVLPLGSFAEMPALERHAEMPVLVFDHPTLGRCSAYPIGFSHEWLLLVSSPHRLQEYQARASPNPGTLAPCQLLCI